MIAQRVGEIPLAMIVYGMHRVTTVHSMEINLPASLELPTRPAVLVVEVQVFLHPLNHKWSPGALTAHHVRIPESFGSHDFYVLMLNIGAGCLFSYLFAIFLNKHTEWLDFDGDSCDFYALENNCADYGDDYVGSDGKTAKEACCACGGGSNPNAPPPVSSCCRWCWWHANSGPFMLIRELLPFSLHRHPGFPHPGFPIASLVAVESMCWVKEELGWIN
jgi:hypothetical protein